MRIPQSFRLKGKLWKVIVTEQDIVDEGYACFGLCDKEKRIIHIDASQSLQKQFSTFLHELCHAMVQETHIPEEAVFTTDIEEILCDAFEDLFTHDFKIQLTEKFHV